MQNLIKVTEGDAIAFNTEDDSGTYKASLEITNV